MKKVSARPPPFSIQQAEADNTTEDEMQPVPQRQSNHASPFQQHQRLAVQSQLDPSRQRAGPGSRSPSRIQSNLNKKDPSTSADNHGQSYSDVAMKRSQNQTVLDRVKAERNHYRALAVELQGALSREKEIVERTLQSANQMQSTMDNRELFLGEQANDDVVMATFGQLMGDIKTWSTRFNAGDANAFDEKKIQDYQRVAPHYTKVSQLEYVCAQKRQKRLFVRGWTAYVMCTKLFRSPDLSSAGNFGEDAWIGEKLAYNFGHLEDELWLTGQLLLLPLRLRSNSKIDRSVVSYKSFNDWRALTAELLGKISSVYDDDTAEKTRALVWDAVFEVTKVVKPWHKTGSSEDFKVDEDKLHHIFEGAVQFARLLRRQRALWGLRFPTVTSSGTLMFNPTCMENERDEDEVDLERLRRCSVELIATPALYKRGTMNGELFEKEEAVRKAVVVLSGGN